MRKKGIFFVLDGMDGTGKDSVIEELVKIPIIAERNPILVKDPSPDVAKEIREILLNKELEESTKLFLFLAARSELLHKQIIPALNEGRLVICNRYIMSTYAYQKFDKDDVDTISYLGKISTKPDLQVILLGEKTFRKVQENLLDDYCETNRLQIMERYLNLSKNYPSLNSSVLWVDGKTIGEVAREVLGKLLSII